MPLVSRGAVKKRKRKKKARCSTHMLKKKESKDKKQIQSTRAYKLWNQLMMFHSVIKLISIYYRENYRFKVSDFKTRGKKKPANWNREKWSAFCMQGRSSQTDSALLPQRGRNTATLPLECYTYLFKPLNIAPFCCRPVMLWYLSLALSLCALTFWVLILLSSRSSIRNKKARAATYREHIQIHW